MIKAVIFDCFGVLTTDGWLPLKQNLFGHDPALFEKAGELNKQADLGVISYPKFIDEIAKLAGEPRTDIERQIEQNVANKQLFEFIETLKPKYKIGLLSNAADNWLSELFSKEELALFDGVSLSCDSGFIKPDSRAFEAIATELDLPPDECLLIDDQQRYCDGAQAVGMPAICYKNFADFQEQIKKYI